MEDNKKTGGSSFANKVVIGAIILIVIFLIIFIGSKNKNVDTEVETTKVVDESVETNNGALRVIQPIMSGDYKYEFTGVKWTFDTTSPEVAGTNQTWIKMEFADFTRNGNAIAFGTPYKLGVHAGKCKQVDFIDTMELEGIPFSYVQCSGQGVTKDFVALQEMERIVVKMNETKDGKETGWKDWFKINVTEIVR